MVIYGLLSGQSFGRRLKSYATTEAFRLTSYITSKTVHFFKTLNLQPNIIASISQKTRGLFSIMEVLTNDLFRKALGLNEKDRAALAGLLIESLAVAGGTLFRIILGIKI